MQTSTSLSSHARALLSLGLPIMVGQLGTIVLGFADTMMIGHHSTVELAAASFVNNVINLAIIFGMGFAYGLTPVVGSFFGRGEKREAGQALRCSLVANSLVAIVLMAVLTAVYLLLPRMGQPEELLPVIRPYFVVSGVSLVAVMWFNAFKQFTDGITATSTAMWILILGNVLNIFGNWVLIYGKLGLPELGLLGAGLSTMLSRFIMVALYAALFFGSRRWADYRDGFLRTSWSWPLFRRLNALGWPIAAQMGMESASFSLCAVMVGWLGTLPLAAHQVMITISTFTFMIYYGLGAAVSIRVSLFHGRGDREGVRCAARSGLLLMIGLEVLLSVLVFSLRNVVGSWFSDDVRVGAAVVGLMVPFLIYQFGDGLQITFSNALRGIARVRELIVVAVVAYFVVSLPSAYVFAFKCGWGLVGIWSSFPFGLTLAGTLMWWCFSRATRRG